MENSIKPTTALLILLLFGGLLIGKFWAAHQATAVPGPSHLRIHPDGSLFVRLGTQLYALSATGEQGRYALDALRLGPVAGSFTFFSDGDVLLRSAPDSADSAAQTRPDGLFRCDLETLVCSPFAESLPLLGRVVHLEIDPLTDRVFVADTGRHRILMLGPDGRELDRYSRDLKFPNQIRYRDGRLYVANTNRFEIAVIGVEAERFGRTLAPISTDRPEIRADERRWPVALSPGGEGWWVIVATTDLSAGGIYRFDRDGVLLQALGREAAPDPVALVRFGDWLVVSDRARRRLVWFDTEGAPAAGPDFPVLRERFQALSAERDGYRQLELLFTVLFAAALALGFVAAWSQLRRQAERTSTASGAEAAIDPRDPDIHWLEPDAKVLRQYKWLAYLTLIPVPLILALAAVYWDSHVQPLIMAGAAGLLFVLFFALYRWLAGARLGIRDELLVLRDWHGNLAAGSGEQIRYSDQFLVIGKVIIPLVLQNQSVFSKAELVQRVYPLMRRGRYLGRAQAQALMFARNPWLLWPLVLLITGVVGVILFFPEMAWK